MLTIKLFITIVGIFNFSLCQECFRNRSANFTEGTKPPLTRPFLNCYEKSIRIDKSSSLNINHQTNIFTPSYPLFNFIQKLLSIDSSFLDKVEKAITFSETRREEGKKLNSGISLILIFSLLLTISAFVVKLKKQNDCFKEEKLGLELLKMEIKKNIMSDSLKAIELHIENKEADKALKYLSKFKELTASIIRNSEKDFISLTEELKMAKNYLALESMQRREHFTYNIDVEEGIEANNIMMPPLLFQPFIENALKYNARDYDSPNHLEITFKKKEEKYLCIRIIDKGSVIPHLDKLIRPLNPMELQIFRKRIAIFEKRYRWKIGHRVNNLKGKEGTGMEILVKLPLKTDC